MSTDRVSSLYVSGRPLYVACPSCGVTSIPTDRPVPAAIGTLSAREREILVGLARGRSNRELADDLIVSEATVKTHVSNLLTELGVRSRVQAVVLAYEAGVVRPGERDDSPW